MQVKQKSIQAPPPAYLSHHKKQKCKQKQKINLVILKNKKMENKINKTVNLDLVGIDGNAYSIMGAFRRQARREGWSQEEIDLVLEEAQSGDYNHLLATIISYCEPIYEDDENED